VLVPIEPFETRGRNGPGPPEHSAAPALPICSTPVFLGGGGRLTALLGSGRRDHGRGARPAVHGRRAPSSHSRL
jgi:hypothetical protein